MSNASSITGEEKKENMVETFVKNEENEVVDNILDDSSQDLQIVDTQESDSVGNVAKDEPEQEGEDEFEEDEYEEQEQESVEPELKLEPSSETSTEVGQSNVEISGEINQNEPKTEVKLEESVEEVKPNLEQTETEDVIVLDSKSPSPAFVRAQSQETEEFLDYEEDLLEDPLDEQLQDKDKETGTADNNSVSTSSDITSQSKEASATSNNTGAPPSTPFAEEVKKTSIWIRGMAPSTKASSVKQLTSQYGKVIQSKIFNSRPINGEIKNCFALVTFAETQPMDMAIAGLHKKNYQGRVLRVEKVSESHLTNSAERIAKEKKVAEVKDKPVEENSKAQKEPSPKKRAIIMAPENTPPRKQPTPKSTPKNSPKKAARQTIQAPKTPEKPNSNNKEATNQKPSKRPPIQAPPRSKSREGQPEKAATASKRKPITFDSPDRKTREPRSAERERDSRRTITAAVPSVRVTRKVSPIRTASGRAGTQESLIISARVDTSNCRGGGATIKRSVERGIPNNISTSQLRRNQINAAQSSRRHVPQSPPPPRASYQTEQYSREHSDNHRRRHPSPPIVRDHYEYYEEEIYEEPPRAGGGRRRRGGYEEPEPLRRRLHDEHVASTKQTRREKEMLEALERQRVEEELRRENERIVFEREKLERQRLELELEKQKFALEQAQRASMRAAASGDRDRRGGGGSSSSARGGDRDSRRRPAEDALSSATPAKLHTNERASRDRGGSSSQRRGDNQSGRHSTHNNSTSTSSSRHSNTTYGIQTGSAQLSTRGAAAATINNEFMYGDQARGNSSYPRGGAASNAFDTHSSLGGYQNYNGYTDNGGYQVWGGLDAQGNMAMDTNWTGATPSSSSSSGGNQWTSQQQSYGNNSSSSNHRRDYGYRNNY
ncbi:unnamed protein product [Caenorhabditis brenneri]